MDQKNAPKNTKENMSVFTLFCNPQESDKKLIVAKFYDDTFYLWTDVFTKENVCEIADIGCWRVTKKRKNKTSEWEKVLDSKITREQRLNRLDIKFSSLN